jgi:hypothetical protein
MSAEKALAQFIPSAGWPFQGMFIGNFAEQAAR